MLKQDYSGQGLWQEHTDLGAMVLNFLPLHSLVLPYALKSVCVAKDSEQIERIIYPLKS